MDIRVDRRPPVVGRASGPRTECGSEVDAGATKYSASHARRVALGPPETPGPARPAQFDGGSAARARSACIKSLVLDLTSTSAGYDQVPRPGPLGPACGLSPITDKLVHGPDMACGPFGRMGPGTGGQGPAIGRPCVCIYAFMHLCIYGLIWKYSALP